MSKLNPDCTCVRTNCKNHGDCEACRARHHSKEHNALTACERAAKKAERKERRENRGKSE